MFPGAPKQLRTAQKNLLKLQLQEVFRFGQTSVLSHCFSKESDNGRRLSDACVRILNVCRLRGTSGTGPEMGACQAAISDSHRRGQTGSEILPALLKRLGLGNMGEAPTP